MKLAVKKSELYTERRFLMSRLAQNSFIAALLPLSFLWTLVACVSICERESSATHRQTNYSIGLAEIRDLPDCGGCPFVSFPKATPPERARYVQNLEPLANLVVPPFQYFNNDRTKGWLPGQLSTESPPIDLLPALRI